MSRAFRWLAGFVIACAAAAVKVLRRVRRLVPSQQSGGVPGNEGKRMHKQGHPISPSLHLSVSPSSSSGSGNPHGSAADPGSDPPPYGLSNRGTLLGVLLALGLTAIVTAYVLLQSPPRPPEDPRWHMPDVDPALGRQAIITHGCGGCHVIPGVPGATGRVGPQLTQFHAQTYIAGVLPNLPENLALWIRDPQSVNPDTAMPTLPVTPAESRHIAAYLYSLP